MRSHARKLLVQTWLLLMVATLTSLWLGASDTAPGQRKLWIPIALLTLAVFKCRLVIRGFMDVRFAPRWLKRSCDGWLLLNFAMISTFYLVTS